MFFTRQDDGCDLMAHILILLLINQNHKKFIIKDCYYFKFKFLNIIFQKKKKKREEAVERAKTRIEVDEHGQRKPYDDIRKENADFEKYYQVSRLNFRFITYLLNN